MDAVEADQGNQVDFGLIRLVDTPMHVQCIGMELGQHRPVTAADCSLVCEYRCTDIVVDKEEDATAGRVELLEIGRK